MNHPVDRLRLSTHRNEVAGAADAAAGAAVGIAGAVAAAWAGAAGDGCGGVGRVDVERGAASRAPGPTLDRAPSARKVSNLPN